MVAIAAELRSALDAISLASITNSTCTLRAGEVREVAEACRRLAGYLATLSEAREQLLDMADHHIMSVDECNDVDVLSGLLHVVGEGAKLDTRLNMFQLTLARAMLMDIRAARERKSEIGIPGTLARRIARALVLVTQGRAELELLDGKADD